MPYWDNEEFEKTCRFILVLKDRSDYYWRNEFNVDKEKISDDIVVSYEKLKQIKKPIIYEDLDKKISEAENMRFIFDRYFYLPPLYDLKYIATMFFKCDFNIQEIQFRIELNMFKDARKTKNSCFGMRFENGSTGNHGYFHAQVCTRPSPSEKLYNGCSGWIPTSTPCVPLVADTPLMLMLSMLVSLYGKNIFKKLFNPRMNQRLRLSEVSINSFL